jgi:hypothetical protein
MANAKRKSADSLVMVVTYPGSMYTENAVWDRKIEQAAEQEPTGSGMWFQDGGIRDLTFEFVQRKAADAAAARVRKLHRQIKVEIYNID